MRIALQVFSWFMVAFLILYQPGNVIAATQDLYRIETVDGSVIIGILVSENDEQVTIRSEILGEITILKDNIRRMRRIDPDRIRDGEYWYENPQGTRHLFAPNAIGLAQGRGYYQNTWIFFNNVNYGLSGNFSIGGGLVPLFLLGVPETPAWILPKYSIQIIPGKFYLAAGAMVGGVIGEGSGGLVYGVSTFGNPDNNLTFGLGYGYAGSDWSNSPMINLSGMTRVSRTLYFITENYLFPGTEFAGLISGSIRWASENFAVDFGLVRPLAEADGVIGVPWLGVTLPFGG